MILKLVEYWRESLAYGVSGFSLLVTLFFKYQTPSEAYFAAGGAIIIVAGVLLASSRKIERFEEAFSEAEIISEEFVQEIAKAKKVPVDKIPQLRSTLQQKANAASAKFLNKYRYAFKKHEVRLVVIGTLLNGLGDLLW